MFVLNHPTASFFALLYSVFIWGLWPHIRAKSEYCVPQFILLNIPSQFFTAVTIALVFGNLTDPENPDFFNEKTFWGELKYGFNNFGYNELALMGGGFVLGLGDHIGAIAMAFMNPGAAYCIYGGMCLIFGCILNFLIDGSEKPGLLFTGIGIGLCGILILGWSQAIHDAETKVREQEKGINYQMLESGTEEDSYYLNTMSVQKAMGICIFAGVFAMLWSPLSTLAREPGHRPLEEPYVTHVLFAFGEMLSIPFVRSSADCIFPIPQEPWDTTRVLWGICCGIAVSSGYFGYFLGSSNFSKTAAFGIICCNNIVAVIIDAMVLKKYSDSSFKVKGLLSLAVMLYLGCVITLSQTL